MAPLLLTAREVAQLLGVSRSGLYVIQRRDASFPVPVRLTGATGHPRWLAASVSDWARSRRRVVDESTDLRIAANRTDGLVCGGER